MSTQQLVIDHLPLAAKIAGNISRRLPRHVDKQDLQQEARLGLLRAAARYDDTRCVQFGAYARRRITGAVIDSLRENDHLSRRSRAKAKAEETESYSYPVQLTAPDLLPSHGQGPDQYAVAAETRSLLDAGIATLPARLQGLVRSYYDGDQTMREISERLGVNESRISQLHARAISMLREHFQLRGVATI